MRIVPKVVHPSQIQFSRKLTEVPLASALAGVEELQDELLEYANILLGRVEPPIDSPYLALQEYATAVMARACEIEMLIHWEEQQRNVVRGSPHYKFRTGQLRVFIELAKKMADLGSRRLTQESMLTEMRYDAGEDA